MRVLLATFILIQLLFGSSVGQVPTEGPRDFTFDYDR